MSGTAWTPMQELLMEALYPDTPSDRIAEILGRPLTSVYAKAKIMGLTKSEAFLASEASGRLNGSQGVDGRFQKGLVPWNKGSNYAAGGRSPETRFKKGNRPNNWVPIGSERLSKEGYLQRKMTDTGYPPRDWVAVHHLLWLEHNGPIPEKHVVIFKDGNKTNIVIDNLQLLTLAENMRRNTIHRYPPELRDLMRLNGRVRKAIEKRHEKQD